MPDTGGESTGWLAYEFAQQFARAFEAMAGSAVGATCNPRQLSGDELENAEDPLLWRRQGFSLDPDAFLWVGARRSIWEKIGNQVLGGSEVSDGDTDTIRSTYLEILNQALSAVASALSARAHKEVACQDGQESAPSASGLAATFLVELNAGEVVFPILAGLSRSLLAFEVAASSQTAASNDVSSEAPSTPGIAKPTSIDLLLDVELPVSVSFGRAQLALKDVIKLTTGSIVELNRAISEPVDIIVNNCVIARGEVVVVEGNYGIRIRQVISRQERLRTLY